MPDSGTKGCADRFPAQQTTSANPVSAGGELEIKEEMITHRMWEV